VHTLLTRCDCSSSSIAQSRSATYKDEAAKAVGLRTRPGVIDDFGWVLAGDHRGDARLRSRSVARAAPACSRRFCRRGPAPPASAQRWP
jgi:hypothetical protein